MIALLALACADGPSDPARYLETLDASPYDAHVLCAGIGDEGVRGECRASNALRVDDPEEARGLCLDIVSPVWRDECLFLVADREGLVGEAALDWCAEVERYRGECVARSLERAVVAAELPLAVGSEVELAEAVRGLVETYEGHAPEEHRQRTARALTARWIATRWQGGTFDVGACGAAPEPVCALAYRQSALLPLEAEQIEALCDGEPDLASVSAAGSPGWTEDSAEIATGVWSETCAEVAHRRAFKAGATTERPPRPQPIPLRDLAPR